MLLAQSSALLVPFNIDGVLCIQGTMQAVNGVNVQSGSSLTLLRYGPAAGHPMEVVLFEAS